MTHTPSPSVTPAKRVVDELTARGQTVSVAESLTGGLVSAALVTVPGSSSVFRGGIVAYSVELKKELVGVPGEVIDAHGVVSGEVARALAEGVRRRCGTDWGIGTTGVAGPESHGGQSPGVVWLAVSGPDDEVARRYRFSGDREHVHAASVERVLYLLDGLLHASSATESD
ncbi:MAG TPA: CinA family protein [Candidatus Stackebrandtia excrementipullorum]|nr:CinA family protein [Candidatus Stackebrandtia excrementipullorum]